MRDGDVRAAIRAKLHAEHVDDTDTRIVEEMGIWSGSVRIDVAVINGEITGYELKSDRDTLERLPTQAELYGRVFDKICLVVGERHAAKARRSIPRWWGVIVAKATRNGVALQPAREAKPNPSRDPLMVARLLWREEALAVLEQKQLATGWKSKSAAQLHQRLADCLPMDDLSAAVRATLKKRDGWLRQPVCDEGQVAIDSNLDPRLPAAGIDRSRLNLLDARVAPAAWNPAKGPVGD
jgi:hypothetical protein